MKVLVEFDLTCPKHLALFRDVQAKMHAEELPEVTKEAVETLLGSGITEKAAVTTADVRAALKQLLEHDETQGLEMIDHWRTVFGVGNINEFNGDQCALALNQINKAIQHKEVLANGMP